MTNSKNRVRSIANVTPSKGQHFTMNSETIPDQSLTIYQILANYTRGLPIGVNVREPIYDNLPDLRGLDLVEIQEMKENNLKRMKQLTEKEKTKEKEAEISSSKTSKEKTEEKPQGSTA